ncbi:type II toxin-antitoxin system VapC family toxin [Halomonas sp. FeN2]|jgi:tRNA(fMet)-specific endonuclease VapC|uniref:type II toxin-antitoxin system VapC family toxin n=1 Tax=Halomonadaceae TaxID=28256 RepID=UPI001B8CF1D3|nr:MULTISPECIES: type II toxin-antitoxin system VapC family toxin [Halomonas]MBS3666474.1 type II toxin-antitoxin system VapC family toxin [Halomonas boliviensis]UBR48919.1 type II toxin-antitoxin system VapC family toxin [Halomonas sp. FeN2]|tara:strand:- start:339 stop:731 length:393 start_codon:yes stop_codon:yes gene_type:complete
MYVLDTNTLIYFFKGMGSVADNLLSKKPADIGIPAIVLYELELGIAKSAAPKKRAMQLDKLIDTVQILGFSTPEAKASAQIRATLEKQGTPIGPYDTLIAGTALANQGTLVTHNTGEFKRIKKLAVEDWY